MTVYCGNEVKFMSMVQFVCLNVTNSHPQSLLNPYCMALNRSFELQLRTDCSLSFNWQSDNL
jgi:hypothetical protein